MSWVVPLRPAAIPAWRRLQDALDDAGPTACRDRIEWIDRDPAARQYAVQRCQGCPVRRECGAYADAAGERGGVWGGTDRTPRKTPTQSLPLFNDNQETA